LVLGASLLVDQHLLREESDGVRDADNLGRWQFKICHSKFNGPGIVQQQFDGKRQTNHTIDSGQLSIAGNPG
jgi:hypothetical protein